MHVHPLPRYQALSIAFLFATLLAGCNSQFTGCLLCSNPPESFLVVSTSSGQILHFPISQSGALGTPTASPGPANSVGIIGAASFSSGSQRQFVYASDPQNGVIDAFLVNLTDGSLSAISGSPFSFGSPGSNPTGMALFGTVMYIASTNGSIAAFNVNGDGTLSAVPGSPFAVGSSPRTLLAGGNGPVMPATTLLFAADVNDANGSISVFSASASGTLTPVAGSPFPTVSGSGPEGMLGGGTQLYVALSHSNAVAGFNISSAGALTPMAGSPYPAGHGTSSLASASGFFYALNTGDHTISMYTQDPNTGALTMIGSPVAAGGASGQMLYNNGLLYVPDPQNQAILVFSANPVTGALAQIAGSPFPAGASPVALTVVAKAAFDPPV